MAQVYRVHSFLVILSDNSRYKNILENQKIVVILERKPKYLVLKKKRKKHLSRVSSLFTILKTKLVVKWQKMN